MDERHPHRSPPVAAAVLTAVPTAVLTAVLTGAAACGTSSAGAPAARPPATSPEAVTTTGGPSPPATTIGSPATAQPPPAPGARLPKSPAALATAVRETTARLGDAVDAWIGGREAAPGEPPEDVVLLALHQQRLYRHAARHPDLASRAFARLHRQLKAQATDNTEAIRELLALARPISPDAVFRTRRPRPAAELLGHFERAERRFGVEWEVLAAVMFAETKFGRVRSDSHAGAQGPMQFMPATWRAYGMGGDVQDPRDAVMGAAHYLKASGAPGDYRRALYAYNPSRAYVEAIQRYARQMRRDPRAYYAYYNWQVFVLTTAGERRLTGP